MTDAPDEQRAQLVAKRAEDLQISREAKALDLEIEASKNPKPPMDVGTLEEMLKRQEKIEWRMEGLWVEGGVFMLVGQRKLGKTTMMGNLIGSLVTGEPFLGRFPTKPVTGTVMLLNYEMTGNQLAHWIGDMDIPKGQRDKVILVNLRGRENPLATEKGRADLKQLLIAHKVEVLIIDPWGKAYTNVNQQDNGLVGEWQSMIDRLCKESGVKELVVVNHAGWATDSTGSVHARGASELEGWPDTIARLSQDKELDGAPRFFEAQGRFDDPIEKDQLRYDPETRTLTLTGTGGPRAARTAMKVASLIEPVLTAIRAVQGIGATGIEDSLRSNGVTFQRGDPAKAIKELGAEGRIVRFKVGTTVHHYTAGNTPPEFTGVTPLDGDIPLTLPTVPALSLVAEPTAKRKPKPRKERHDA